MNNKQSTTLAVKYRPRTFDDVSEQTEIKTIIENQIRTGDVRNAYLFCGGAGTGKTTSARIVAAMINEGKGTPVELDAASNNSVEDVRNLIKDARFKPMDSKYRVYILDEVHMLSISAFNAMLKLLEEPPPTAVFILCTTDPHKIPGTVLSRVQRYNFQRISQTGIVDRLMYILRKEYFEKEEEKVSNGFDVTFDEYYGNEIEQVCDYVAKLANGGMRDAISMLDKCLAFKPDLTVKDVEEILSGGVTVYDFLDLTQRLILKDSEGSLTIIEESFMGGVDMTQFLKQYYNFLLQLSVFVKHGNSERIVIPKELLLEVENKLDRYPIKTLVHLMNGVHNIMLRPVVDVKILLEAWVINVCM